MLLLYIWEFLCLIDVWIVHSKWNKEEGGEEFIQGHFYILGTLCNILQKCV